MQLFFNTGVAYNFQLDMTETNNIDPSVDILTFSGKNTFTSPVNGLADRIRENTQTFTVTDTFAVLRCETYPINPVVIIATVISWDPIISIRLSARSAWTA